jgi:hypothetical protein
MGRKRTGKERGKGRSCEKLYEIYSLEYQIKRTSSTVSIPSPRYRVFFA